MQSLQTQVRYLSSLCFNQWGPTSLADMPQIGPASSSSAISVPFCCLIYRSLPFQSPSYLSPAQPAERGRTERLSVPLVEHVPYIGHFCFECWELSAKKWDWISRLQRHLNQPIGNSEILSLSRTWGHSCSPESGAHVRPGIHANTCLNLRVKIDWWVCCVPDV